MRIKIEGECESAKVLRGYLIKAGYVVNSGLADYSVHLEEKDVFNVIIDGVDCELERKAIREMEELGVESFTLARAGGIRSDREIKVVFPEKHRTAVEKGILRALLQELGNVDPSVAKAAEKPPKRSIKKAIASLFTFSWIFLVLCLSIGYADRIPVYTYGDVAKALGYRVAQNTAFPIVRFYDGGTIVEAADAGNDALKMVCVSGCGGASSFADSSAFTFASTAVNNISAVVDDVAVNTVAENSAGAVRMSTSRVLLANLTDEAGTDNADVNADGSLDVTCVSGCSGSAFADNAAFTFGTTAIGLSGFVVDDAATNSVTENSAGLARMSTSRIPYFNLRTTGGTEIASGTSAPAGTEQGLIVRNIPSGTQAVSGTFWQATQPVSGTVTVTDGAGALNVIVDSGTLTSITNSVTVTDGAGALNVIVDSGTITATGTVTANQGTANTVANSWPIKISDGTDTAEILNLAANDPLSVAIVDGSGTQITSFGGGVQYTEADTDASITGTAMMWEDTADTLRSVSAAKPLPVNVVAGGAGDGAILDGVSSAIKATVLDYTNSNPIAARLTDTNGDYVSVGGGTQYTEDVASAADPIGTQLIARRRDSLVTETTTDADNTAVNSTAKGELYVKHVDSIPVTGTFWQATQPVSATDLDIRNLTATDTVTVTDGSGSLNVIVDSGTITVGTFPDNEPINVAQKGGTAIVAQPCERETHLYVQISQTTGTQLITGTASERIYICSIQLMTATAQNVALVDGTGSVCATSPTGLLGGSTAATGWNFAANGGIVLPVNMGAWAKTSTDADNVCLLQSSTGQISGVITYISIPNI